MNHVWTRHCTDIHVTVRIYTSLYRHMHHCTDIYVTVQTHASLYGHVLHCMTYVSVCGYVCHCTNICIVVQTYVTVLTYVTVETYALLYSMYTTMWTYTSLYGQVDPGRKDLIDLKSRAEKAVVSVQCCQGLFSLRMSCWRQHISMPSLLVAALIILVTMGFLSYPFVLLVQRWLVVLTQV